MFCDVRRYDTLYHRQFLGYSLIQAFIRHVVRVVKSKRMRWAGHVARMGEGRGVHRVLVGKPEGKRPLGRPRRRWVEVGGSCGD